ncbi:MAG: hypothetical protein RL339_359 [Pseudomonadota bacterium]|jgi:uncharacterized membrane protein YecN with MAPEG domain
MPLPITAAVAAACAILLLLTAVLTVQQRLRLKVAFGDGGDARLVSASRSHANLAEHAPIVILLLGLLENAGANAAVLALVGGLFVFGRVAHIIGLHRPSVPGKAPVPRQIGVILTWLTLAGLSVWTILLLASGAT